MASFRLGTKKSMGTGSKWLKVAAASRRCPFRIRGGTPLPLFTLYASCLSWLNNPKSKSLSDSTPDHHRRAPNHNHTSVGCRITQACGRHSTDHDRRGPFGDRIGRPNTHAHFPNRGSGHKSNHNRRHPHGNRPTHVGNGWCTRCNHRTGVHISDSSGWWHTIEYIDQ